MLWKQWALPSSCWARKRRAAISAKVTPPRKNTSVSFCSPELDWEDETELPEAQNTHTHWSKHALLPWSYQWALLPVPVYTLTLSINTNTLPPISKHLLVSKHTFSWVSEHTFTSLVSQHMILLALKHKLLLDSLTITMLNDKGASLTITKRGHHQSQLQLLRGITHDVCAEP